MKLPIPPPFSPQPPASADTNEQQPRPNTEPTRLAWWHDSRFRGWRNAGRRLVRRYLRNETQLLFALTIVVGFVCGLVAVGFHVAIRAAESLFIERATHASGNSWILWTIVSPTVGGLLAGAALTWLVPGARGSGIPQVKQAYATEGGRIKFRDALGKFFIGTFQIGSGASLGREGPTVQICAGATSALARAASLPPRTAQRLLPVGVAAGIAAAFNAPIAAVTFTIEEIVGTLDQAVLSGVVVAAALAAVIERGILGVHPVIEVSQPYGLDNPISLVSYALLGVAAAIVAVAFTDGLLRVRVWFRGMQAIPSWARPGIGGLITGALAVAVLYSLGTTGITGGGYQTLSTALAGGLGVRVLLVLCIAKILATVFSYSSGGAGGIFAPSLFIGAMLGGAFGYLDVFVFDHGNQQLGAFALVGMGAVFAGVIRAPITSVLIIFEMTGGYGLVLPLMLANMTAFVIARHWRPTPIYEALLAQDGIVLPHGESRSPRVHGAIVATVMARDVVSVLTTTTVAQIRALVAARDISLVPVVNWKHTVVGAVHVRELPADATGSIAPFVQPVGIIRSDAPLLTAAVRMNEKQQRQLVVVDATDGATCIGIITMSDIVRSASGQSGLSMKIASAEIDDALWQIASTMTALIIVPSNLPVVDLLQRMRQHDVTTAWIRDDKHDHGVTILAHLADLAYDPDLQRVVIAADVAEPFVRVSPEVTRDELVTAFAGNNATAALVFDANDEPIGVLTKSAFALATLTWRTHFQLRDNVISD